MSSFKLSATVIHRLFNPAGGRPAARTQGDFGRNGRHHCDNRDRDLQGKWLRGVLDSRRPERRGHRPDPGDNTGPHIVENSFRKAYTARTFRIPSGDLVTRLKNDPSLGLIHLTNVIANQGALPIKIGEQVIGAAGASGAPGGEKDEACVKAGIDKVADQLK